MSEGERAQGASTGVWLGLGVLGMFLVGGCLVACLGFMGLGFALPAAQKARQAARNQAEAEKAARQAEQARATIEVNQGGEHAADADSSSMRPEDSVPEEAAPESDTEDSPAKDSTQPDDSPDGKT